MTNEEIVAALAEHRLTTPRQCLCGWRQDGEWSDTAHAEHLLPTVLRVAEQRAAEEVLAAADWLARDDGAPRTTSAGTTLPDLVTALLGSTWAIESLEDRAAALTATLNHGRNAT